MLVICPSRGRPKAAYEVLEAFDATFVDATTRIVFAVDADDETLRHYPPEPYTKVLDPPPGNMMAALNEVAARAWDPDVLGFIGDDHRFRTPGWDAAIDDLLEAKPGVAYADDGFQHEKLPTNWFISRPIVDVFGMGLPALHHLWIDNYWKTLAGKAGCLYYLPDILIEHMHPFAGKAEMDAGYARVNSQTMIDHDYAEFLFWREHRQDFDVARLREVVTRILRV